MNTKLQPPKAPPKIYHLLLKTHTLTILITTQPNTTIASLKSEALSALKADVNQTEDVPTVSDEGDFEISRAVKGKGGQTGQYEVLEETQTVKGSLTPWENVFLQFRDSSGKWPALLPPALSPLPCWHMCIIETQRCLLSHMIESSRHSVASRSHATIIGRRR